MLLRASILVGISLATLAAAQDASAICKGAPQESLRCCDATSYAICNNATSACQFIPFSGTCANNKLDINFPDIPAAYQILHDSAILPDDLIDDPAQSVEASSIVKRARPPKTTTTAKHTKTTTKKANKMLGLSPGAATPTGPPLNCQVIGNVVLDRCDLPNALFDHWLGDDPCDYGC